MKTPAFKPHYNRELGKRYYSAKDYVADMKKSGVEPYNPSTVAKREESKPYQQSEWAKEMVRDIKNRNGRAPGDRFVSELAKRGYTQEKANEARRLADGK